MTLFALTKTQEAGGQIALAALLGIAGMFLLLPRPRGRFVSGGIAALAAAAAVFGAWTYRTFGNPLPDTIGTVLFWLFSAGALVFGTVLVVQKNPARGAIAFAFVILSTCGLFLLLAAPFLMAATIIIYAGAIIVTFLFVLMLSHAEGPSDENDRSREPLIGGFAGFAFIGLVLFTLYQTSQANASTESGQVKPVSRLPVQVITADERKKLAEALTQLDEAEKALDGWSWETRVAHLKGFESAFAPVKTTLAAVVGASSNEDTGAIPADSLRGRLEKTAARPGQTEVLARTDPQTRDALQRAARVREASRSVSKTAETVLLPNKPDAKPDISSVKAEIRKLRDEVALLYGMGELPADNVRNLGLVLYSEHLLAIELAGTLLLVATIGAVAITQRKGVAK